MELIDKNLAIKKVEPIGRMANRVGPVIVSVLEELPTIKDCDSCYLAQENEELKALIKDLLEAVKRIDSDLSLTLKKYRYSNLLKENLGDRG